MSELQQTIKAVNATIREFADDPRIPSHETWEFFCECGCFTLVTLSLRDFDAADGVWAAGHAVETTASRGEVRPST